MTERTIISRKGAIKLLWGVILLGVVIALVAGFLFGGKIDMNALMDDDPVIGDPDAPITIIEFSDFQCPYCRAFYTDTLPQLKTDYIDTGKVKLIYRDFPLPSHEGAQDFAEAAECAEDQGKWELMHDKIFDEQAKQGEGAVPYPGKDTLKQWAGEIGLDKTEFRQCLDAGKYTAEVQKDIADGTAAGVGGTPTFFIDGEAIRGAYPFAVFKQKLDSLLS